MIQRLELLWNTYFDFDYGIVIAAGMFLFASFITVRICLTRRRGESMNIRETGCIFVLCIYLTFLFGVTLFNRHPKEFYSMELTPLWSYRESLFNGDTALGQQIFYNIVAFMPLGIIFPILYPQIQTFWRTAAAAAVLSVFIEVSQLIFRCGLCELDDVMNNTLGAVAGYGVWKAANIAVYILKNSRRKSSLS